VKHLLLVRAAHLLTITSLALLASGLAACAAGGAGGDDSSAAPPDGGTGDAAAGGHHDGSAPRYDAGGGSPTDDAAGDDGSAADGASGDDGGASNGDAGGNDMSCGQLATKQACQQCCVSNHKPGYQVYAMTLESCACTSPGACKAQCATEYCVQKPTSGNDPCATCLGGSLMQGSGACYAPVAMACQADLDCTSLFGGCIPECANLP